MNKLTVKQLREMCIERGIRHSYLKKEELIKRLTQKQEQEKKERQELERREREKREEKDKIEVPEKLRKRDYYNELCRLIRKGAITEEQKEDYRKIRKEIFGERKQVLRKPKKEPIVDHEWEKMWIARRLNGPILSLSREELINYLSELKREELIQICKKRGIQLTSVRKEDIISRIVNFSPQLPLCEHKFEKINHKYICRYCGRERIGRILTSIGSNANH